MTAADLDAELPDARQQLQAWDEEQERAREAQREVGRRLREVRKAAGLSLQAVEERSAGVWKAVVVGSYERGDRSMTIHRLIRLCDWYGVTIWDVLPNPPKVDELIAEVEARIAREQRTAGRRLAARMLGQVAATIIAGGDVDSPEDAVRHAADAVFDAATGVGCSRCGRPTRMQAQGFTAVKPTGSAVAT